MALSWGRRDGAHPLFDSYIVMNDRWTLKSGSLSREREPGKEIQPPLVVSRVF